MKTRVFIALLALHYLATLVLRTKTTALGITFIDVGQGDASLVVGYSGESVLIDGGPGFEVSSRFTNTYFTPKCDLAFGLITHLHDDHYEGIERLMPYCDIKVLMTSISGPPVSNVLEANALEKTTLVALKRGDTFSVPPFDFHVLWPPEGTTFADINDSSVVVLMDSGDYEVLFTGDITSHVFDSLDKRKLESLITPPLEIYKVAHHGSKYSLNKEFLEQFPPRYSVIGAGNNSFGHPHPEVLEFLTYIGSEVYVTKNFGDITFVLE